MNNQQYKETKEDIRDRMIHTAMSFWGIKRLENMDPAVRILIEALAEQLYLQSNELADMEARVMDKVSRILIPEEYANASPAHSILHIVPGVPECSLGVDVSFSLTESKSPLPGASSEKICFSPVCPVIIRRGEIKMMIAGGEFFRIDGELNKRLIYREDLTPDNYSKLWVGFKLDNHVSSLKGVQFYIDFPDITQRRQYTRLLSHVTGRLNGQEVKFVQGIQQDKAHTSEMTTLQSWTEREKTMAQINVRIADQYRYNYLTITTDIPHRKELYKKSPSLYEKPSSAAFDEISTLFEEDLLWLELSFPPHFPVRALAGIFVALNTVPVVNKRLVSTTARSRKTFGVIPLELDTHEYFLAVQRVTDSYNRVYCDAASPSGKLSGDGNYSVRKGGCESFGNYDARSFLIRFQDILLENMSAFEALDRRNNMDILLQMDKLAGYLHHQIKDTSAQGESSRYLFVDQKEETDFIYADYWTTYGEHANGIHAGTQLKGISEDSPACTGFFLTPTTGGRPVPSERLRIARFKYLLGSRDRIVTNQDIRNFCMAELADTISDVRIEKGIMAGRSPGEGLIRTIDIHLLPLSPDLDSKTGRQICDDLYSRLSELSPMTFNYRIFIN